MKWANEARLDIVHREGLESKSRAKFRILYSYDEPIVFERDVPPNLSTYTIYQIAKRSIPNDFKHHCLIEIERYWVVEDFPSIELLHLTRYVFKVLLAMYKDLLQFLIQHELRDPATLVSIEPEPQSLMPISESYRRLRIKAATDQVFDLEEKHVMYSASEALPTLMRRYPNLAKLAPLSEHDPASFAEALLPLAMAVLKRDGFHVPILWLRTNRKKWNLFVLMPEEQVDKYIIWDHIAKHVEARRADAIVFISEAWMAPLKSLETQPIPNISHAKGRKEVLQIYAEDADGKVHCIMIPFRRILGRVLIHRPFRDNTPANFVLPVRRVWGTWRHGH